MLVLDQIKSTTAKELSNHIVSAISPHIANIFQSVESINNKANKLNNNQKAFMDVLTPDSLEATIGWAKDAANAVSSSVNNIKNAIELLTPFLKSTQKTINTLFTKAKESNTPIANKPTYSSVVKSTINNPHS